MSEIVHSRPETLSFELLKEKLPTECFLATIQSLTNNRTNLSDEEIYRRYFESVPEPSLTEEEKDELFHNQRHELIKSKLTTSELRSLLDKPQPTKKQRGE